MGKADGFLSPRMSERPLQLVMMKIIFTRATNDGTRDSLPALTFNHYNKCRRPAQFSSPPYRRGIQAQSKFSDLGKVPWLLNKEARIPPAAPPGCRACAGSHCTPLPPRTPESSSLDPRPVISTLQKTQSRLRVYSKPLRFTGLCKPHGGSRVELNADSLQARTLPCWEG